MSRLDPFKTPTKRQPATFVKRQQQQPLINNPSFEIPPSSSSWASTSTSQIPDQELSFVDELLELHDDETSQQGQRPIILDINAPPTPKHETPKFARRLSESEIAYTSHETTVLELSKLISHLQADGAKTERNLIDSASHQLVVMLFVVFVALFGVWMASSYRPFCSSSSSWYPCRQCPPHAICSTFRIESCYQSPNAEFNYTIHENGQLCIRNDSTGLLSYQISIISKDYLENLAYKVDCLGKANVTKKVSRTSMEDYLVSYLVQHQHVGSSPSHHEQHIGVDSTFTHAFNTMIELFEENEFLYRIAVEGDSMHSYRFQSSGSCLLAKQHFQRFIIPKEQFLTSTEMLSNVSSSETVMTAPTTSEVEETSTPMETTTTPTPTEEISSSDNSNTSNTVNAVEEQQPSEELLSEEEIF
ncbi:hypothetical protein C9374_008738 [Naegleria lovaniensis]|uniref:Uncharacterized protein n=1 Tax=Naegleria lovaniensis TaxID=51637 RepID=A0AA88KHE8_NAELO|nr:uncharacterized protein C9374_008738 [Naegleria lovaniensis]KAG2378116.1 hypothetical protein C9374_008738 [Naegleria lovaniensis]